MSRFLEHDPPTGAIRIRFNYDERIVAVVRALPRRRWHPDEKFWSVPADALVDAARVLVPLGFVISEELKELLAQSAVLEEPAVPVIVKEKTGDETLTISMLNDRVRGVIAREFRAPVWVSGEVIGYDRNAHKNHVYFQLAEKSEGEDKPRAVVTAVLFAGVRERIDARIELKDGLKIRVLVRADLYPPSGSYQVIIEDLDPEFSLGEIARRREKVLAEIEKLGLQSRNTKLAFPRPCLRIGLITSFGSDAYNDFVNELERSGYAFDICAHDVHVQGRMMEQELLGALAWFADRAQEFDVLAIVRGGGARTDLMHFDALEIGLAVARHPLKVIVGIGHHRDQSVLDFIAHSEKTPTACARRLITLAELEESRIAEGRERLVMLAERRLTRERAWLERSAPLLARSLQLALERAKQRVHGWALDLDRRCARRFERRSAHLERARGRLAAAAPLQLARARERIAGRLALLRAADPERLLARGYAWLKDSKGRSVKSVRGISAGQDLTARLADGALEVRVTRATSEPPPPSSP